MKKTVFTIVLSLVTALLFAQIQNPVQWTYVAEKKSANTYQIIITATLPKPWHIYSQTTPKGGPVPTKITFNKNPLVTLNGTTQEVGTLKVEHDKNFGVDVKYFDGKVQFVEIVNLKATVKTTVSGNVEYMVCNDSQCLPPTKVNFEVKLQ
jgi:thiol:disulfide interchange protein DsbD